MAFNESFHQERKRLLSALGEMADGGLVEDCQHIGATRILENDGSGCIDIALAVYPLDAVLETQLNALGYSARGEFQNGRVKRYCHVTDAFQLLVVESGEEAWGEFLIVRDYLLSHAEARARYVREQGAWEEDGARKEDFFSKTWSAAQKWWIAFREFSPVRDLARELAELGAPWRVVGGWSLELFLGTVNRVHNDLDVEIAYADQMVLQEYMTARGWRFVTPFEKRLEVWLPHTRLKPPRHQAHAHREGAFLDFLLSDIQNNVWKYRRDPSIVAAIERISLQTEDGIPFIAPEVTLLYKSRNTSGKDRANDENDFQRLVGHLKPEQRAWLYWALQVTNPAHPWLEMTR